MIDLLVFSARLEIVSKTISFLVSNLRPLLLLLGNIILHGIISEIVRHACFQARRLLRKQAHAVDSTTN